MDPFQWIGVAIGTISVFGAGLSFGKALRDDKIKELEAKLQVTNPLVDDIPVPAERPTDDQIAAALGVLVATRRPQKGKSMAGLMDELRDKASDKGIGIDITIKSK